MRVHFSQMIASFGLAVSFTGLVIGATGCTTSSNNANPAQGGSTGKGGSTTGTGGKTSATGGSTSAAGGSTSATGGSSAGVGGSSGTTSTGGMADAALPADGGSGGVTTDGGGGASTQVDTNSAPRPDANFKMPKLNNAEYTAKFDPSLVPGIEPLFDGETLKGWNCGAAWSVKDGTITAGPGFWGFCPSSGTYDKFRWFASIIQDGKEGDGGHTGMGVDGTPFYDLMTPSCVFWDYAANTGIKASGKCVDLALSETVTKTLPGQAYWHTDWFQVEMLVDLTKGTIRAALNGVDFVEHTFKPKSAGKPAPIGVQAHNGGSVRYKDLWIEVNPKEPDKLLSVTK